MSKIYLPHASQFDLMNKNLEKIANAIGTDIDISTWAGIQKAVRAGVAPSLIPVGTQLSVQYSTSTTLVFDVVAHDHYKSVFDENAHTMTLMLHDGSFRMAFDEPEAFYYADVELPAGTYNFTLADPYYLWEKGTYQFTLTKALPAGGHLCISSYADTTAMTSCQVKAWRSAEDTTSVGILETVDIISGEGGTNLGTLGVELNHAHRVSGGSNNYKESAVRLALNCTTSFAVDWKPETKFDRRQTTTGNTGFTPKHLDPEFLAVVGEVIVPCAANSDYESPDSTVTVGSKYTLVDKFYLPSIREIVEDNEANVDDGTTQFQYFKGSTAVDRIKYISGNTVAWWTRSAYKTHSSYVGDINVTGQASNHHARYDFGVFPVCTIV